MSKNAFVSLYLCFLGLGGSYLLGCIRLQRGTFEVPGSGLFPLLIGIVIVALSFALLIQTLTGSNTPLGGVESFPKGADFRRVAFVTLALFLYAFLLNYIGYLVCTTGLMVALLRALGLKKWGAIALIAILTGVLSYGLFVFVLDVPLPRGEVFP
jgi:putative tricarboxylic transport membrane protein